MREDVRRDEQCKQWEKRQCTKDQLVASRTHSNRGSNLGRCPDQRSDPNLLVYTWRSNQRSHPARAQGSEFLVLPPNLGERHFTTPLNRSQLLPSEAKIRQLRIQKPCHCCSAVGPKAQVFFPVLWTISWGQHGPVSAPLLPWLRLLLSILTPQGQHLRWTHTRFSLPGYFALCQESCGQ